MEAQDLIYKKYKNTGSIIPGYSKKISEMMIEYAKIKCEEQKQICYHNAIKNNNYESILTSDNPEMK